MLYFDPATYEPGSTLQKCRLQASWWITTFPLLLLLPPLRVAQVGSTVSPVRNRHRGGQRLRADRRQERIARGVWAALTSAQGFGVFPP